MNLSKILSLSKVPRIVSKPALTERANTLVAILNENDLTQPPQFLNAIKDNTPIQDDLKKRKTVSLYGRPDEMFNYCHVACEALKTNYKSLSLGANIARNLMKSKTAEPSLYFSNNIEADQVSQFLNGFSLGNYKFDRKQLTKTEEENGKFRQIQTINVIHDKFNLEDPETKFLLDSAKYSLFCRELLNARANEADPEHMLNICKELAKVDPNIKIEYIVGKELQDKGLNLLYDVGKASEKPSSLVCLKYEGNPRNAEDTIAFIGKGVCFDTGGLNLKPTGGIENMHFDKGGACTVLAAFLGAVEMKLPVNLVCSVAIVENSMSGNSMRPKDIVRSHKGLTVEIGNTDAEGRLILADAMTYTQWNYKPKTMLEFSTLTGAVKVALGNEQAGLFSNDDGLANQLYSLGQESNEGLWRLPITDEHREDMKSAIADLNNKGKSVAGGASKAAAFLENFVEKGVKWAHIDIAGTSFRDSDKFVYSSGATGHGVKLLLNYLRKTGQQSA